ncbi:nicotinate-nucleotide adenylyltransferase [Clostridium vitabionis]|jgi:nicotinate-nucleotide adenylyltransferase|uniref:nicotinate-nucleotide adenylyltransferase n=1 Tax=Clostridium vitabionis TaxID=2784388 RepID=UPI00188C1E5B|nr:nicotinate-nucleotide adenylyltransferase [Clostridium vitabionis]
MKKIGLMGGTFDPIHLGHLNLARQAYTEYGMEEIWFLLSKIPPHKRGQRVTPEKDREAMVRLAIRDCPGFVFSDYELRREGSCTYTSDTLRGLARDFPGSEFWFIAGEDSIRHIESWHEPEYILTHIPFLAARREDEETLGPEVDELSPEMEYLRKKYGARIRMLHCREMEISSSEIRRRAAAGLSIREFVPGRVADYIEENGLYRGGDSGIGKDARAGRDKGDFS